MPDVKGSLYTDIQKLVKTLDKYAALIGEERKKFLEYAAVPIVNAAQSRAPQGIKVHYRYNTAKVNKKIRAPKGMGQIAAKYLPGNLKKSIGVLRLRKTQNVYVGPKMAKGQKSGTFGGARTDAYYAAWIEYGAAGHRAQPFMRPALPAARGAVIKRLDNSIKLLTKKYAAANGL
jgi:HK97 gp10 family phage protein